LGELPTHFCQKQSRFCRKAFRFLAGWTACGGERISIFERRQKKALAKNVPAKSAELNRGCFRNTMRLSSKLGAVNCPGANSEALQYEKTNRERSNLRGIQPEVEKLKNLIKN
jgi:hypothetical protein